MKSDSLIIVGPQAISEALSSNHPIDKVFVAQRAEKERLLPLLDELKRRAIPCLKVPLHALERMAGQAKRHQGIVARGSVVSFVPLDELLIRTFEAARAPLILVAEGCTDVRNLGAMARAAEALGADALVLGQKKSAALGPSVLRTSAGALLHLSICRMHDIKETFELLRSYGLSVIASSEHATHSCHEVDLSGPVAIIMGAEGNGLPQQIIKAADHEVRIPTSGQVSTLR